MFKDFELLLEKLSNATKLHFESKKTLQVCEPI